MTSSTPDTTPELPPLAPTNPHVLWRQVLGFVLWVGVLTFFTRGLIGAVLCLALGGVTFADAWQSGIYKHPGKKGFLNISPMSWGIAMALLFIVAYPAYLLSRRKLRTREGTNAYFWSTVVLGAVLIALQVLEIVGRTAMDAR